MKYSIIILLEANEVHGGSFRYFQDLHNMFLNRGESFEILIICYTLSAVLRNDLSELLAHNNRMKAFEFGRKTSQATCIKAGIKESSGEIIVVCGSYKQITDKSFVQLLDNLDDKTDIVVPWRRHRVDTRLNQFQSKIFNAFVGSITRTGFHDLSCTVKVFRREVLEEIKIYGNMYRFLPILTSQMGSKVKEVECEHYQQRGIGKFGIYSLSRYCGIFLDVLTLYFNAGFAKKPLRFFSTIGTAFLLLGGLIVFFVFAQKFFLGYSVGGRPILLIALLFLVLGIQTGSAGLLGEIIAFTHGRHRKEYTIEKII